MLKNDDRKYGFVARFFHWAVALLILGLLSVGFWMVSLEYSPFKGTVYGFHKSFGMIVLVLAALRILWKSLTPQPAHLPTHAAWEVRLAAFIHTLLYIGMILMPLSGWVMSSAGQHAVPFFWLFNVPPITPASESLADLAAGVHEITAYILLLAVSLHYAGALKHHLIDRDETLRRMGGNLLAAAAGAVLIAAPFAIVGTLLWNDRQAAHQETQAGAVSAESGVTEPLVSQAGDAAAVTETEAPLWTIDKADSRVGFEFTQYGQGVAGTFGAFEGVIRFDPDNLAQSMADIRIEAASIATGDAGRDEQAHGAEWFDAVRFPHIHFVSQSFTRGEGDSYTAAGTLTIRDVSRNIAFPFTLAITGDQALMKAELSLSRLDFGVGQGPWTGVEAIGADVKITVSLAAARE